MFICTKSQLPVKLFLLLCIIETDSSTQRCHSIHHSVQLILTIAIHLYLESGSSKFTSLWVSYRHVSKSCHGLLLFFDLHQTMCWLNSTLRRPAWPVDALSERTVKFFLCCRHVERGDQRLLKQVLNVHMNQKQTGIDQRQSRLVNQTLLLLNHWI